MGESSFGFLSSAVFGMEERSGAMEGAPLFGFDSKEVGDSVAEKGSHVVVATPLNVAAPGGMRWSPGTFADGIISVAGKEGKGEVPASQGGAAGGSGGSNDTLIGLELGKRTYFEVPGGGGGGGGGQAPSQAPPKKLRIAGQTPKCQVEGCKTNLTSAKDYHRRHKVCAIHSKAARVIVAGQEQRFCQQCSRFLQQLSLLIVLLFLVCSFILCFLNASLPKPSQELDIDPKKLGKGSIFRSCSSCIQIHRYRPKPGTHHTTPIRECRGLKLNTTYLGKGFISQMSPSNFVEIDPPIYPACAAPFKNAIIQKRASLGGSTVRFKNAIIQKRASFGRIHCQI